MQVTVGSVNWASRWSRGTFFSFSCYIKKMSHNRSPRSYTHTHNLTQRKIGWTRWSLHTRRKKWWRWNRLRLAGCRYYVRAQWKEFAAASRLCLASSLSLSLSLSLSFSISLSSSFNAPLLSSYTVFYLWPVHFVVIFSIINYPAFIIGDSHPVHLLSLALDLVYRLLFRWETTRAIQ